MEAIHDLRSFLEVLRRHGAIHDFTAPVDRVHELGALLRACEQDGRAAFFHDVKGADMPVVGGVLGSHERIALAVGCPRERLGPTLEAATRAPVPCIEVAGAAPCHEVTMEHFVAAENVLATCSTKQPQAIRQFRLVDYRVVGSR